MLQGCLRCPRQQGGGLLLARSPFCQKRASGSKVGNPNTPRVRFLPMDAASDMLLCSQSSIGRCLAMLRSISFARLSRFMTMRCMPNLPSLNF